MIDPSCGDCPYQFKGGVKIDCRSCLEEEEKEDELTEEDLEAQRTDAAERENHRKEVEGEEIL